MSVREDVLAAANPREALLVLADAIDALQSKPADPWGSWDEAESFEATREQLQERAKPGWENEIHTPGQRPIEYDSSQGEPMQGGPFTQATEEGAQIVDFPPPTEKQIELRARVREYLGFEDLTGRDDNGNEYRLFDREDTPERQKEVARLLAAFDKAGPVWLYLANRDHILQLPIDVRSAMLDDVWEADPKYAYQMGRDILMDRDDQGADRDVLPVRSESDGAVDSVGLGRS